MLHVLSAEENLLDLILHQAITLYSNISEFYLADGKFEYFPSSCLDPALLVVMLLVSFILGHLVLFHQFMDGLERSAFFIQFTEPLLKLLDVLAGQCPDLILVYELYLF